MILSIDLMRCSKCDSNIPLSQKDGTPYPKDTIALYNVKDLMRNIPAETYKIVCPHCGKKNKTYLVFNEEK